MAAALVVACGGQDLGSPPADGGADRRDAATQLAARLEVAGQSRRMLAPGGQAEFAVRYSETDGTPISGATVGFALEGNSRDATLGSLQAATDTRGIARGTVTAGQSATAFRIRITASRAAPAFIDISVSDRGFGRLLVRVAPYEGDRGVERLRVHLFAGKSCEENTVDATQPDRTDTIALDTAETQFLALAAGLDYAVQVDGLSGAETPLARGCTDGIRVMRDVQTVTTVSLADRPLQLAGLYDNTVAVESSEAANRASMRTEQTGNRAIDEAGGDAAWLLDAVESHLRAIGAVSAAEALALERDQLGLSSALGEELSAVEVGPSVAVGQLAEHIGRHMGTIALSGALRVSDDPSDGLLGWGVDRVSVGDEDTLDAAVQLEPATLGSPVVRTLSVHAQPERDAIALETLQLRMPLGTMAQAFSKALAESRTGADRVALLRRPAGCDVLAEWSSEQPIIADTCDAECVQSGCGAALQRLLSQIDEELGTLDTPRAEVRLGGRLSLIDDGSDLQADRIVGDGLEGKWTGAERAEDIAASGTWRATRSSP